MAATELFDSRRSLVRWTCMVAIIFLSRLDTLSKAQLPSDKPCFCQLSGRVHECACTVDTVDEYNNRQIYPLLQDLLEKNFFRYYKVNMDKECPFWKEQRECASKECGIQNCDDEVPAGLRTPRPNRSDEVYVPQKKNFGGLHAPTSREQVQSCAAKPSGNGGAPKNGDQTGNRLDPLDKTISQWQQEQFRVWAEHDVAQQENYCDVDDEESDTMHYVDLQRNPERYTGYKGDSAQRVWKSIYEENCFKPDPKFDKNFLLHPTSTGLCLEKRVFFRLISGLHTSITVSIASHNYQPPKHRFDEGKWTRNVGMFKGRFSAETTNGEGPERLRNLYFVYLLELRALQKIAPYLDHELFYTGDERDDEETRKAVQELLSVIDSFEEHFDESAMFQYDEARSRQLREEFRQHFLNISRIMDCVGCDKCRLWGKLQTHGIGTALKILFSNNIRPGELDASTKVQFQLQRNDLVALLQSIGRFAGSIYEVAEFRRILGDDKVIREVY